MIHNKDFTGKIVFKYYETDESDRSCTWKEQHFEGGIEVVVPEQTYMDVYHRPHLVPAHTELLPFTDAEKTHLKLTFDRIKMRVKQELNT